MSAGKLTPELYDELQAFDETCFRRPYSVFPAGKTREALRKLGLVELWKPTAKNTGRLKPWRITEAGRKALEAGRG